MIINRLILVDRNLRDLRVVEASARRAGFEVAACETIEDAWTALQATPFDLLVVADEPPHLDAFAFSQRVKAHPGLADLPVLLLVPNLDRSRRLQAIQAGAEDALGKPSSTAEILSRANALCRRRTRDRLMAATSLAPGADSGRLEEVPPVDLVGILESWGRSGVLHLRTDEGMEGVVYLRDGKPVDAEVGPVAGMPALARVLGWERGTFHIELKTVRRPDVLKRSTGDLLVAGLDPAHAADSSAGGGLDPRAILAVDAGVLARMVAGLSAELNGLIRLCDGKRSVRAVIDASALPDPEAMKALAACEQQGILRRVLPPPAEVDADVDLATPVDGDELTGVANDEAPDVPALAIEPQSEESTALEIDENDVLAVASPLLTVGDPLPPSREAPFSLPALVIGEPAADLLLPGNQTLPLGLAGPSVLPEHLPMLVTGAEASAERPPEAGDSIGELSASAQQVVDPGARGPGALDPSANDELSASADGIAVDPDARAIAAFFPGPGESATTALALGVDPTLLPSSPPSPSPSRYQASASAGPPVDSDDEFTTDEALAELGLYGRGRRLRWRAAALALTAVLAFGAHRWFTGRHAAAVTQRRAPALTPNPEPQTVRSRVPGPEPASEKPERDEPAVSGSSTPPLTTPVAPPAGPVPGMPNNLGARQAPRLDPVRAAPASVALVDAEAEPKPVDPEPRSASRSAPGDRVGKAVDAKGVGHQRPSAALHAAFLREVSECRTALEQHRRHHSMTACGEALASNPDSPEAMTLMAHAEMNRGHMDRARELASKAAAIDPRLADAYVILGGALQDSGRDRDAKVAYRKYLQLAPHGRYADELRSIVRTM